MRGLLRVGLWETRRQVGGFDLRATLAVAVAAAAVGVFLFFMAPEGVDPDAGVFVADGGPQDPLTEAAARDARFRVVDEGGQAYRQGAADLWIQDGTVHHRDTDRGRAAAQALSEAVRAFNRERMAAEADQAAAFPVIVDTVYEARRLAGEPADGPAPPAPPANGTSPPGGDGSTGSGDAGGPDGDASLVDEAQPAGEVRTGLRPDEVEPPFPMRSVLLTFAYLVPAMLVAQVHAGSLQSERIRERGVLLLSAPLSRHAVLAGKTLPYAALLVLMAVGVTWFVGAGAVGLLAALVVLGFLLAATTLLGLTARSLRELTFLQVGLTTSLSTFLFLPAVFTALPPVAFLSPMHVVAASIRGETVAPAELLYALLPMGMAALALGALSFAAYREETLFAPGPLVRKFQVILREAVSSSGRALAGGMLCVPFAFALQLMLLVLAVTLSLQAAFVAFLFGGALVEELLKGTVAAAHQERRRPVHPALTGLLVGGGFFLAEKGALVLAIIGFGGLPYGLDALRAFGVIGGFGVLLAPLALHSATAAIVAWAARRGRFAWGLWAAVLVHAAYNTVLVGWAL